MGIEAMLRIEAGSADGIGREPGAGGIGAAINQMAYGADNLTNVSSNATQSRSTIMDTDYALATTQLAKTQIIQQAATAMLAQANQQPQGVMALLKG
jgi:flagellin